MEALPFYDNFHTPFLGQWTKERTVVVEADQVRGPWGS